MTPRSVSLFGLFLPGVASACMTGLLAGAMFLAPVSPLALGRADSAIGQGMPNVAAERLMVLVQASPKASIQKAALERVVQVRALELDQPSEARDALELLLSMGPTPSESGLLRERMAELYLQDRLVSDAANQFKRAWLADPARFDLLARAADLQASLGNLSEAREHYKLLRKKAPRWTGHANLGLGQVALQQGRETAALRPFQAASRSGSAEVAAAARLGLATCYERLGELEGALAEIEQTDLPDDLRERRKNALRKRADDIQQP